MSEDKRNDTPPIKRGLSPCVAPGLFGPQASDLPTPPNRRPKRVASPAPIDPAKAEPVVLSAKPIIFSANTTGNYNATIPNPQPQPPPPVPTTGSGPVFARFFVAGPGHSLGQSTRIVVYVIGPDREHRALYGIDGSGRWYQSIRCPSDGAIARKISSGRWVLRHCFQSTFVPLAPRGFESRAPLGGIDGPPRTYINELNTIANSILFTLSTL